MTSDLRKAAILLMSLPQEEAALLLGKLKPKQIEAVSIEIARLEAVSGTEQQSVIYEFADANPNAMIGSDGGLDLAKSLVQKALGKEARDTLDNVQQSIEALPFGFLKRVDPQNLVTFINDEHPQTIALILSHLPPAYGAQIVAALPPERQISVIQRIAHMGQTNPDVIKQVEAGLESRMTNLMSQQFEKAGGVSSVAEILNVTDRTTERSLLENLAPRRPRTGGRDSPADVRLRGYHQVAGQGRASGTQERRKLRNGPWHSRGPARSSRGRSWETCPSAPRNCCARKWNISDRYGPAKSKPSSRRSWTSSAAWKMQAKYRPAPRIRTKN